MLNKLVHWVQKAWWWICVFFCIQTFLLSIRASSHCQVIRVIFICRLSVSRLWWDRWKLRTVLCPLLPRGLQTLGRVCFACSAEWKLFPPSGRWCSVCSPCGRSRERESAAIKSDLPQCLMVAKWCKHRPRSGLRSQRLWLWELKTYFVKHM